MCLLKIYREFITRIYFSTRFTLCNTCWRFATLFTQTDHNLIYTQWKILLYIILPKAAFLCIFDSLRSRNWIGSDTKEGSEICLPQKNVKGSKCLLNQSKCDRTEGIYLCDSKLESISLKTSLKKYAKCGISLKLFNFIQTSF